MAATVEVLISDLTSLGLMTADEVQQFLAALPAGVSRSDAEAVAKELVRSHKLTLFQASTLYQGRGKTLRIENYLLLEKLGAGGMGTVYKAEHARIKRQVALKVLSPSSMASAKTVQRFRREVEAVAKLSHPNIVTAFDAGEAHGVHFLVMEYVKGRDLAETVRQQGPLALDRAVDYIMQAACGLQEAHSQGIIHRDIKPANLLLDETGTVKILDMGLARFDDTLSSDVGQAAGLTQSGTIMGTVDYMSPEQALDTKKADARADIYSLGCSLYYLLAGQAVYAGDTLMKKLLAHREQPVPSLCKVRPDVPESVDAIFQKMVAKNPAQRFQTISEVHATLTHWQQTAGTQFAGQPAPVSKGTSDEPAYTLAEANQSGRSNAPSSTLDRLVVDAEGPSSRFRVKSKSRPWLIPAAVGGVVLAAVLISIPFLFRGKPDKKADVSGADGSKPSGETAYGEPSAAKIPPLPLGTATAEPLPGLARNTPAIAGLGRWQVDVSGPRRRSGCVAWAPDDRRIVVGSEEGDLRVYDTTDWRLLNVLPGHTNWVQSVAWSPDGTRIASADGNGVLRLWRSDGTPGPVLTGDHRLSGLEFSPDGRTLATFSMDHLDLYKADGTVERSFPTVASRIFDVAFSQDGAQILATVGNQLKVYNVDGTSSGITIDHKHQKELRKVSWSKRGAIAVTDQDGRISVYSAPGAAPVQTKRRGNDVAWSPDGDQLAVATSNGVQIRSPDGDLVLTEENTGDSWNVEWSRDGKRIAFSGNMLGVWQPFGPTSMLPTGPVRGALDWEPAGRNFVAGYPDGVRTWSSDGKMVSHTPLDGIPPTVLKWSRDGKTLAMGVGRQVGFLKAGEMRPVFTFRRGGSSAFSLGWSPDNSHLAVAGTEPIAAVFDLEGQTSFEMSGHHQNVRSLAWNDAGQIATGDDRATVRFWNSDGTAGSVLKLPHPRNDGVVSSLAWSPGNNQLAAAIAYGPSARRLYLIDAKGNAGAPFGPTDSVAQLAWSPDGKRLVAGSENGVSVWNIDGSLQMTLDGGGKKTTAVGWSRANRITAWAGDGSLRCWDGSTGQPMWIIQALRNGDTVTINPDGEILSHSGADVERSAVYLVEREHGRIEVLSPSAFNKLRKSSGK